jgi:thiamine phosphate synthase YjbQ (UPF0047 family)
VSTQSSPIVSVAPEIIATTKVVIDTRGQGFTEITQEVARFITEAKAKDGALFLFMRHTSASLVIQENADPDVRTDLTIALDRLPMPAGSTTSKGPTTCRRISRPCSLTCRCMFP